MVENDFGALGKDDIEHILFSHGRSLDLHCRCSKMKEKTGSLCDREVISPVKSPLGVVGRREARTEALRQLEVTIILQVNGGRWGYGLG